mgnify:CR=1 FL=1
MRTKGTIIGLCVFLLIVAGFAIGQMGRQDASGPRPASAGESDGKTETPGRPAGDLAAIPDFPAGDSAAEPPAEPGDAGQPEAGESPEEEPQGGESPNGENEPSDEEAAEKPDDAETPEDGNAAPPLFSKKYNLPDGFVYADDHIPGVLLDIRYFGEDNFVGARIDGYKGPYAILTKEAADALAKVQEEVRSLGYTLLIYDAYRPQKAVEHFKKWSRDPDDTKTKADYYPDLEKSRLFKLGYIASRSGHSRGSTVDLTLADAATGEPLDMGGPFDFFGEVSHHGTSLITEEQAENRRILKEAMERNGFRAYAKEWWHYTLADEPYPDTYFDFDVE